MNLTQQRFLLNRLDEAKRSKPSRYGNNRVPVPPTLPKVKQAEAQIENGKKVVAEWEKQVEKARTKITDMVEAEWYSAKQAILFAETPAAIAAVEKFEKMKF